MTMPSFEALEAFIKEKPACTICEIRDYFGQRGIHTFATTSAIKIDGVSPVVAYEINEPFWHHLQQFMKQDHVKVEVNEFACGISDSSNYTGNLPFLPVTISIQ